MGDVGDDPRKIEVLPRKNPIRKPMPEPSIPTPAPAKPAPAPEPVPA